MATEAAEERLKQLEVLFTHGSKEKGTFSIETLLDVLLLLYDECCNSTLRRDKNVSEFIEHGKRGKLDVKRYKAFLRAYLDMSRFLFSQTRGFENKGTSTAARRLRSTQFDRQRGFRRGTHIRNVILSRMVFYKYVYT